MLCLRIGGPDGHSEAVRQSSSMALVIIQTDLTTPFSSRDAH